MERSKFDVKEAQRIRDEYLAPAAKALEKMAESQPEHGQYLTFSKNHVRASFMELGFGMALTNGLDPYANKVKKAEENV